MVRIFYSSDTSSEARQMNRRQILLINLLNRRQRFDSDARRLTLKDTDQCIDNCIFLGLYFEGNYIMPKYWLFQSGWVVPNIEPQHMQKTDHLPIILCVYICPCSIMQQSTNFSLQKPMTSGLYIYDFFEIVKPIRSFSLLTSLGRHK